MLANVRGGDRLHFVGRMALNLPYSNRVHWLGIELFVRVLCLSENVEALKAQKRGECQWVHAFGPLCHAGARHGVEKQHKLLVHKHWQEWHKSLDLTHL